MKIFGKWSAKEIGDELGINLNEVKPDQFTKGLNVESEYGTRYPETTVTDNEKKDREK